VAVSVDEQAREIILSLANPTLVTCIACKTEKPLTDMSHNNASLCRECHGRAEAKHRQNYRLRHPEKARAEKTIQWAIQSGKIKKYACAVCGTTEKVEAHHPDYSKPLEVVWLCREHHLQKHGKVYMNFPTTEKIVEGRMYNFASIIRDIGLSRTTLVRWRSSGRLVTVGGRSSRCTGLRLREAIEGRLASNGPGKHGDNIQRGATLSSEK
jgi:hypothetical protein